MFFTLVLAAGCATTSDGYRAGTAKVKITPETYGWLVGHANRKKPAEGVTAELWARVLALEDGDGAKAILVTADLLGFPPEINQAIRLRARARFGLKDGELLLVASHTHGGPALPQRPKLAIVLGLDEDGEKAVAAYGRWLVDRILDAVGQALAAMAPAQVSLGRTRAAFGISRRNPKPDGSTRLEPNPEGIRDTEVPVLWVEGGARAVVFTYACHCTTLLGDVHTYHGDYAGVAADTLERTLPGATALFATGCGGDINPHPRGTFDLSNRHGQALAEAVAGTAPATRPLRGPLRLAYRTVDLPLDAAPKRHLFERLRDDPNVFRQRHSKEMLKRLDAGKLPVAVSLPIQSWRFGSDLTLVALGGEVCVEYAIRLKRELGPERTWVVGYANEVPCYIPSEKVLREGGYEAGWDATHGRGVVDRSMLYYGWPAPFAPGIEDRLVSAVRSLVAGD